LKTRPLLGLCAVWILINGDVLAELVDEVVVVMSVLEAEIDAVVC
jgi:hypothetical protein